MAGKMAGKWARRGRLVVAGLLLGAVLAGCAGQVDPVPRKSYESATKGLSESQLYDLAVSQYRQLFEIFKQLEFQGGSPQLPETAGSYVMDPAWSAINKTYSGMYFNRNKYVNTPDYRIVAIEAWETDDLSTSTVTAIHTCELMQGAAMVNPAGEVLQDGSPVIMHRRGYFKFDLSDGKLKVFILNGEAVETCPINLTDNFR